MTVSTDDAAERNERLVDEMRQRHKSIPYPTERADFARAEAVFDDDKLTIAGHPVMQGFQWEYMRTLAMIVSAEGGDILEIGYGMGLAARSILEVESVRSHTVIECHPDVLGRCIDDLREEICSDRVRIIGAYWEDAVQVLADATFDGILFDTYPTTRDDVELSHFPFFAEAHRLLRTGGVFTYYSDEPNALPAEHLARLAAVGFTDVDESLVQIEQHDPMFWNAATIVAPAARRS